MQVSGLVFDQSSQLLAGAISDAAERQAIYAYNIANASVPGFRPKRFEKDLEEANAWYQDEEFNLEDEIARMTENRLKHSAYTKLLAAKIQIAKKIMTLGKGG